MLVDHANLTAVIAGSTDTRGNSPCIQLHPKGTVSTNGKGLILVPYPSDDPAEYPQVAGVDATKTHPEGQIVPAAFFKEVGKILPKTGRPIRTKAAIEITEGRVKALCAHAKAGDIVSEVDVADTVFPNWERVVPTGEPKFIIQFDLQALIPFLQALQRGAMARNIPFMYAKFEFKDESTAVKVEVTDGRSAIYGLIMPAAGRNCKTPVVFPGEWKEEEPQG